MSSIWTDLLLLHGHALPAHLLWRPNEGLDSRRVGEALERAKAKAKTQPVAPSPRDCGKPACA
ncbi:MAG: hypothetical protein WAM90_04860 [Rhodanobacter sp.]